MQEPIQAQTIGIEGIGSQFAGHFPEGLLHLFGHPHIKDALHQGLNREQVGVDIFQIAHGLLNRVTFGVVIGQTAPVGGIRCRLGRAGSGQRRSLAIAMLFL